MDFTILSWNILAETYYKNYAFWQNDRYNTEEHITQLIEEKKILSYEQRCKLFKKIFNKGFAHDIDIICLQEIIDIKDEIGALLIKLLISKEYGILQADEPEKLGTCIAYSKKKFKKESSESWVISNSHDNDPIQQTAIVLTHRKNPDAPSIKIINCHIPWEEEKKQLNSIKNIISHGNKDGYTVICGDFNYATHTSDNKETKSYKKLTTLFNNKYWNNAGKEYGYSKIPTNYFNIFQKVDYIFYTPTPITSENTIDIPKLMCTEYQEQPKDYKKLIKHMKPQESDGPPMSDFPSDHSALIATFTFKSHF